MAAATYSGDAIELARLSASGDMNSNQYKFVRPATTEGAFLLANGASGPAPLGVLQNDPANGEAGRIRVAGTTLLYVHASAAISYGDFIKSGSDGYGEPTTTACTNYSGVALNALSSGSALIEVMLEKGQVLADNVP